jgi:hypothetical protein
MILCITILALSVVVPFIACIRESGEDGVLRATNLVIVAEAQAVFAPALLIATFSKS